MLLRQVLTAALIVLGLSGCTIYEGYVVTETRTTPQRPVEVAREGGIGDFDDVLVAGADLAAAIIAPVAAVAKAVVISAVDVEVNRTKETRTVKFTRWLSNDRAEFPVATAQEETVFGRVSMDARVTGDTNEEPTQEDTDDAKDN